MPPFAGLAAFTAFLFLKSGKMVLAQLSSKGLTYMWLETSITLDANLFLQCGLSGPTSSICYSATLPPSWPVAIRVLLFGVLSHSLQGKFQTLQRPVETHCWS